MRSNRLAFLALAIACIAAAAGGGYLATRQNLVPAPAQAQPAVAPAAQVAAAAPPAVAERGLSPSPAPAGAVHDAESAAAEAAARKPVPVLKTTRHAEPPRPGITGFQQRPATTVVRQDPAPVQTPNVSSAAPLAAPAPVDAVQAPPRTDERAQEPVRPVEPPRRMFEELVVSADSVIGLQTENRVSSETARVEDRLEARVTRDVRVGGHVAIPAGTRALGSVMQVDRGGKFKEKAKLGVRFHTLVLADGTRIAISTETVYREGEAPGNNSSAKVGGGAVAGAILGAILGGGKGAAVGAAAGAGAGSAAVAAGDRTAATLPAGSAMTVRILQPITVTIDSK